MNTQLNNQYNKVAKLFGTENSKTIKGEKLGFKTFIIYLSPHKQNSLGKNLCSGASEGCIKSCLFTAGLGGVYASIPKSRKNKTEYFLHNREGFLQQAYKEIAKGFEKYGDNMAVRLNGTSDIPFENMLLNGLSLMQHFPHIQFYDYTKVMSRLLKPLPSNYHLTYSMSETPISKINSITALSMGFNVAMVFNTKKNNALPETYQGFEVVDGDENDLTFLRPKGTIIGLRAKGEAKKDLTGFVVNVD
jgi:hypothetical protein